MEPNKDLTDRTRPRRRELAAGLFALVLLATVLTVSLARNGEQVIQTGEAQASAPGTTSPAPPPGENKADVGSECDSLLKAVDADTESRRLSLESLDAKAQVGPGELATVSVAFSQPVQFEQLLADKSVGLEQITYGLYPWTQGTTLTGSANLVRNGRELPFEQTLGELDASVGRAEASAIETIALLEKGAQINAEQASVERSNVRDAVGRIKAGDIPVVRVRVSGPTAALHEYVQAWDAVSIGSDGQPAILPLDPASREIMSRACTADQIGGR